jgi:hypothetical protein
MVITITKYTLGSSYTSRSPCSKGKEIFGSHKWCVKLPLGQRGIHIGMTMLNFLVHELMPLLFETTMDQMCMMVNPLLMQDVTFLFSCMMLGKCMNLFVIMVFDILNDVLSSSIFNVLHCKRTANIITWPKLYGQK